MIDDVLLDEIRRLRPARREILFTLAALDESTPLTVDEVDENLPEYFDLSRHTLADHLRELARDGFLRKGKRSRDQQGHPPITYEATPNLISALVKLVETRARQLRSAKRRLELERSVLPDGWSTVVEQEDLGGSRYAEESPFCPDCGSVWAGEGPCEDCLEAPADGALADGGERP